MQPNPAVIESVLGLLMDIPGVSKATIVAPEGQTGSNIVELIAEARTIRFSLTAAIPIADGEKPSGVVLSQESPTLFIASIIPDSLANRLRQQGAFYADTLGNLFISVPGFYAYRQVPVPSWSELRPLRPRNTVLNPSATRIALRLLYESDLAKAPLRRIAEVCGIALRSAQLGMEALCLGGCLADLGKGGFKVVDRDLLLKRFVDGYNQKLRNKLFLGLFSPVGPSGSVQGITLDGCDACWGGDEGAVRLSSLLNPQEPLVYVYDGHVPVVARNRLRLDPKGSVALYAACWPKEMESMPMVAPWVVVYADLLYALDPRCHEVAQGLFDMYFRETDHGQ